MWLLVLPMIEPSAIMEPHRPIKTDSRGRTAYRLREASEMTGIPVSTFRKKIRCGDLNPITGLGVWLIAADDLQTLLNRRLRN
jgi:hypothetical protein